MDCYDQFYTRKLMRTDYDIRFSELDSKNPFFKKLKKGEVNNQEVDGVYAWFFIDLIKPDEPKEVTICEDQNENEKEIEDEDEDEDEDGDEDDVYVDENIKDPEYLLFLENLTEHGKSYKLKISKDDEEPDFVYYEEDGNLDWCDDDFETRTDNSGDEVTASKDTIIKQKAKRKVNEKNGGFRISTKKEVSRRKKVNDNNKSIPQGITADSHCNVFLNGAISKVKCEEEEHVEYEKNVTTSDSDVVILDNVENWSEVKNKQLVLAETEPSLREKLMHILKVPYNEKEYEELSEYIEQEKPVYRLRPLRKGRSRSFAKAGINKTMLDYGPERFRSMLNAAQNDRPKALNLLRMFRFWLEHFPNEDAFQPWKDKDFLKVRPSEKNARKRHASAFG